MTPDTRNAPARDLRRAADLAGRGINVDAARMTPRVPCDATRLPRSPRNERFSVRGGRHAVRHTTSGSIHDLRELRSCRESVTLRPQTNVMTWLCEFKRSAVRQRQNQNRYVFHFVMRSASAFDAGKHSAEVRSWDAHEARPESRQSPSPREREHIVERRKNHRTAPERPDDYVPFHQTSARKRRSQWR